jgi:hypothetical protein
MREPEQHGEAAAALIDDTELNRQAAKVAKNGGAE